MWLFPEHIVISECDKQMPLMVEQTVLMKDFFLMKRQRHPAGSAAPLLLFVSLQSNNCWEATSVTGDGNQSTRQCWEMRAINKDRKKEYPVRRFFSKKLEYRCCDIVLCAGLWPLLLGLLCVSAMWWGCSCAASPPPPLPQIRAVSDTRALSLKNQIGIYNSAFSNQRDRIMWWDSRCFTRVILNMNCFSCESHAAVRQIKLRGKCLEYLSLYSKRLAEKSTLKFFTKWEKNQSV